MGDPKDLKEQRRVQALKELGVLDTPPQAELDDLVYLASQVCHTPMAMISLVDERRQWFKAKVGIEAQELPREGSFSAFVIQDGATLIIADATTDPRFAQSPSVTSGLKIKFYAGVPLTTSIGLHIGSLCVMDKTPRTLSKEQTQALEALARQVMVNFENKVLNDQFRENENFYSNILTMLPDLVSYIDRDYCYQYANVAYEEWFHVKKEQIIGKKMSLILGDEAFEKAKPFMTLALQGRRQDFTVKLPYKVDQQLVPKTVQAHYIPDVKPDGSVQGFYSVVSDISKLVSAEEEAHQRSVELAQALSRSRANERSFRAFFNTHLRDDQ